MIPPGKTIGILGGGQLGRMSAIAARRLGYNIVVLDPDPDCPAQQVADKFYNAPFDEAGPLKKFLKRCDLITQEFENIPHSTLAFLENKKPVRPSAEVLRISQNRRREKEFLVAKGFPIAPFRHVNNTTELREAIAEIGLPAVLKTADFGYDGKGQSKIIAADQAAAAWAQLGAPHGVLEKHIPFFAEISVICARSTSGDIRSFPVAQNIHRNHILDISMAPARIPDSLKQKAEELATSITRELDVIGLLAVEMFVLENDDILVNELAPRPHNSGHYTLDACETCQFEQHIRAIAGLPLGNTELIRPAAMVNLLGDIWEKGEPDWNSLLSERGLRLHLYGKKEPRPGRKMGHFTVLRKQLADALDIAQKLRQRLASPRS